MLLAKNNLAANLTGLAYSIADGAIRWEAEPVHLTADQALAIEGEPPKKRGTEVDRAADFLRGLLASGRVATTTIMEQGQLVGFSKGTLRRAKDQANIRARREGFGEGSTCYWELPEAEPGDQAGKLGAYDTYEPEGAGDGTDGLAA